MAGTRKPPEQRTARPTTMRLSPDQMDRLREVAASVGAVGVLGANPPGPSVSALVRMIADGELAVGNRSELAAEAFALGYNAARDEWEETGRVGRLNPPVGME